MLDAVIRNIIKRVMPRGVLEIWRRAAIRRMHQRNSKRSVAQVFRTIYLDNLWGGKSGEFCSGIGSTGVPAAAYCQFVKNFIVARGIKTVADLGCGDFRIGREVSEVVESYVGVDIVQELVERNRMLFGTERVAFQCFDIIQDSLPDADLCLVRQVFQHLSNSQIASILEKFSKYQYVLVTEHYPKPGKGFLPNIDKPHGADTRLLQNSAVVIGLPPFDKWNAAEVLSVAAERWQGTPGEAIKTFLI